MKRLRPRHLSDRPRTVYIGGGTPTVLSNRELERLLELCRDYLHIPLIRPWEGEFTVEANPGTINPDKCRILFNGGVNRVSVGAQSFNDSSLEVLGRVHRAADIIKSVKILRDTGFSNLNIDLIFGLPGQSQGQWMADLEMGLDLDPEHLSIYNLTISPGTPFYEDPPLLPPEEEQIKMMEFAVNALRAAGYRHYEISNYAKDGKYSRHNMVYWEGGEYLGIGAGAHSYHNGKRSANVASVEEYIDKFSSHTTTVAWDEKIDGKTKTTEVLMLGLRLLDGVPDQAFKDHFGASWELIIAPYVQDGFLERASGRVRFTHRGMLVSDELLLRII